MTMDNIQRFFDAISEANRMTRGRYQMTLGKAIKTLDGMDAAMPVVFGGEDSGHPGSEDSYRGYYSDLSFASSATEKTAGAFRDQCISALGGTYEGYKGGDFIMAEDTPIWCAPYGCCGNAIVEIVERDGKVVLVTKDVERD